MRYRSHQQGSYLVLPKILEFVLAEFVSRVIVVGPKTLQKEIKILFVREFKKYSDMSER